MMQSLDSAVFLNSIAKRARKYFLGVTTITQDVEDFLKNDVGKSIVTNSSIQVLMKQHPAAIEKVAQTFYLSEGEKQFLLACDIGEGLFFAGNNHVAMRVVASPEEHKLITSKPEEIMEQKRVQAQENKVPTSPFSTVSQPVQTKPLSSPLTPSSPLPPPQSTPVPKQNPLNQNVPTSHFPASLASLRSGPTGESPPPSVNPLPPRFKSEIIMDNGRTNSQE